MPKKSAQRVSDELINGGIRGIWNFAPIDLAVPKDVKVENVHLSESVSTLIYQLHQQR
ncbi:Redox-sensing transcriptional repressor rex [Clostridioides difficile]|nr:Redox-sensing transcriptional repressor rex [Clostridioides difficile]